MGYYVIGLGLLVIVWVGLFLGVSDLDVWIGCFWVDALFWVLGFVVCVMIACL